METKDKNNENNCPNCLYQPPKKSTETEECPSCFYGGSNEEETDDCPSCIYNGANKKQEEKDK